MTVLAIVGAVLGGWAGDAMSGHARANGFNIVSFFMAVAGAAVFTFAYHTTLRRTDHTPEQLRTPSDDASSPRRAA